VCFGFDGLGEDFADGVEYAYVGDGIRSRGTTDGRSIDNNDFIDRANTLQLIDIFGKWYPFGEMLLE
jgi:hypothetical protein